MSNFNYMDNVPVKIAEKYKPPPRIYQLPQSVTNKLLLPEGHYQDSTQYSYNFQLEKKVLAKIPEFRRMRQVQREARQCRREKREQERLRKVEEQHKQMLGAVSYPNAAELSSSESDDGEDSEEKNKQKINTDIPNIASKDGNWIATQHSSFNNILQPTVLTQQHNGDVNDERKNDGLSSLLSTDKSSIHSFPNKLGTGNSGNSNKLVNSFNYKDFEEDTSSPFDNIELKTINDLDILAQVLNNTQLKDNKEITHAEQNVNDINNVADDDDVTHTKEETNEIPTATPSPESLGIVSDIKTIENNKAALEKVDFSDINLELHQQQQQQKQQNDNIPTQNYVSNNYSGANYKNTTSPANAYFMPYYNKGLEDQNNYHVYHNENYFYANNCNGTLPDTCNYNNATIPHYIGSNANTYALPLVTEGGTAAQLVVEETELQGTKSKSVPDILRELRDEVHNSEMRRRRSRNHSYNLSDSKDENEETKAEETQRIPIAMDAPECYNKLSSPVQLLARNISSMGFPLERVSKIAEIYGDDDKKIVEHLIPLTELLDLGFDETRISEALIKFDNNKEKALEDLIS